MAARFRAAAVWLQGRLVVFTQNLQGRHCAEQDARENAERAGEQENRRVRMHIGRWHEALGPRR